MSFFRVDVSWLCKSAKCKKNEMRLKIKTLLFLLENKYSIISSLHYFFYAFVLGDNSNFKTGYPSLYLFYCEFKALDNSVRSYNIFFTMLIIVIHISSIALKINCKRYGLFLVIIFSKYLNVMLNLDDENIRFFS